MTAINAGRAYAEYRILLDPFRQDVATIKRELNQLAQLGADLKPASLPAPPTNNLAKAADAAATANARVQQSAVTAADALLKQAAAEARLAQAQGNSAKAAATLSLALAKEGASAEASLRAQTQLATIQRQIANETKRAIAESIRKAEAEDRAALAAQRRAQAEASAAQETTRSSGVLGRFTAALDGMVGKVAGGAGKVDAFKSGLVNLAGGLGLAVGGLEAAQLVLGKVVEGFNLLGNLQSTQSAFTTLVGSVDLANQKIREAEQFADRYRLKTTEVNSALKEAAPLIRDSTSATDLQLGTLSRLAALNPAEGIEGAVFALRELTSAATEGEAVLSLVERFGLSKDQAGALFREFKAGKDIFVALDQTLNQVGATNALLEQRTQGIAGAQNDAARAAEQFSLALGNLVSGPGIAFLNFLADAARGATVVVGALNQLATQEQQAAMAAQSAFSGASSYDEYATKIQFVNSQLQQLGLQQQVLTEAQYTYAQALMAGGQSTEQALAAARQYGIEQQVLADGTVQVIESSSALADAQALLAQNQQTAAAASAEASAAQAEQAAATSGLSAEANNAALATYAQADASLIAADSSTQAGDAQLFNADAAAQSALQQLEDAAQSEQNARVKEELAAAIAEAAAAGDGAGAIVARLVQQYGVEADEVLRLIGLYRQLNAERSVGAAGGLASSVKGIGKTRGSSAAQASQQERVNIKARRAFGGEDTETGGGRGGKGRKAKRGGGGGGKSTEQKAAEKAEKERQKAAEKEQRDAEAHARKLEELKMQHEEKMLEIQLRYQEKQAAAEKSFRVSALNSRADFYDALTQATPEIGQEAAQQLSAAYEAAFAEAQRLSAEGKAALADDYLRLKQEQIAAELAFQQKIAAAREKGDQAEVDRLTRIEEIRRQAREEELKQLMESGDANQTERDTALADEQAGYAEQRNELLGTGEAAQQAATTAAGAEAQKTEAIATTNTALREQQSLYQQIAGTGATPTAAQQAAQEPSPPSAAATAATTLPTAANGVVAVTDAATLALLQTLSPSITQLPMLLQGVIAAIGRVAGGVTTQNDMVAQNNQQTRDLERSVRSAANAARPPIG